MFTQKQKLVEKGHFNNLQTNINLHMCRDEFVVKKGFCVGFLPHIVSAIDIFYLFMNEVLVTWFLAWVFRREKTGFQYTLSRLCFVGGHFFFQLLLFFADFEDFSRCAFSLQGK